MTKNILIPTDGSEYSKTALEYGIYIAKRLDARLTVLYGEESLDERVRSNLNRVGERCGKAGLDFQLKKVREVAGEVIVEEARCRLGFPSTEGGTVSREQGWIPRLCIGGGDRQIGSAGTGYTG